MDLSTLDLRHSALLVIDLQNAFIHDKGTLGVSGVNTQRLSAIVPVLADLIPQCQKAGMPVIWTVQEHFAVDASRARKKLAGHTARRKQVSALSGTWDSEIVEELKAFAAFNPAHVIRKHRFGAFYETRLEMMLKMMGVQTLFIAGTTTNACVETSIREAYLRDYDVVALGDCISGVNGEWETTAKQVWKQYFCEISNAKEMEDWLIEQAKPRTLHYGHMLVMVEDVAKSTDFYVRLLGFSERPAKPLADGRPFTALKQGIAFVSGRQVGHQQIDHMAFEVSDVRQLRDQLKTASVHFQQDLHNGPYGLTIYITDPDGVRVELYQVGATDN